MRGDDGRGAYSDTYSDTESISSDKTAFSGPLGAPAQNNNKRNTSKKSARFNLPPEIATSKPTNGDDDGYVEITLDIRDDAVAVHSVQSAAAGHEDPELALLARRTLEGNKSASFKSNMFRSTSDRIKQVSQELKRLASISRRPPSRRFDRSKSAAASALKGFKFIAAKAGSSSNGWAAVEKQFAKITANSDGYLHCSMFGECIGKLQIYLFIKSICSNFRKEMNYESNFLFDYHITGMNKDSKDFAGELFRALARKNNITSDFINKSQLKQFWDQIADESFDSRLQTFFDM